MEMEDALIVSSSRPWHRFASVARAILETAGRRRPLEQGVEIRRDEPWPPIGIAREFKQREVIEELHVVRWLEQRRNGGPHPRLGPRQKRALLQGSEHPVIFTAGKRVTFRRRFSARLADVAVHPLGQIVEQWQTNALGDSGAAKKDRIASDDGVDEVTRNVGAILPKLHFPARWKVLLVQY
jgi:hypothetical protein